MGASLNSSGGSGRVPRRKYRRAPMSEINVTPFVDVMLVLLIIFMVAAPLLTVGIATELPETKASQVDSESDPLTISVDTEGKVYILDSEIQLEELVAKLTAVAGEGYDEQIFIHGDRNVDYGTVAKVMGEISTAGFRRIVLVTELENTN